MILGLFTVVFCLVVLVLVGAFKDYLVWQRQRIDKLESKLDEFVRDSNQQKQDAKDVLERVRHLERKKKRTLVE